MSFHDVLSREQLAKLKAKIIISANQNYHLNNV
jgi:hypothetical protein